MLHIRTEQVIDVWDWDCLVTSTYNRPYNFQQQDGCKERMRWNISVPSDGYDYENDSVPEVVNGPEMGVSFAAWLARDPVQLLHSWGEWDTTPQGRDMWWKRNFYPSVEMLANDLHSKGLLPAGEYVIDIDW